MKIEAPAYAENGIITYLDPQALRENLKALKGEIKVIYQTRRAQRSDAQNKYWWGCVVPAVKEGFSKKGYEFSDEEVHEGLKLKFLKKHTEGLDFETVGSTAKLDTLEFNQLVEKVQFWSAEYLEIVVPDPQQEDFLP